MPSEVQQLSDEAGSYRINEIQECPIQVCLILSIAVLNSMISNF